MSDPQPPAPPSRVGSRREARETALGLLYEADVRGERPAASLARQAVPLPAYAQVLVQGIDDHLDELDELIRRVARDWTIERMPVIDRNILRIGTYELAHRDDVPATAVLAEAVDLVSGYSTDDSGRFVNGVLARLAGDLRPPPAS